MIWLSPAPPGQPTAIGERQMPVTVADTVDVIRIAEFRFHSPTDRSLGPVPQRVISCSTSARQSPVRERVNDGLDDVVGLGRFVDLETIVREDWR